jgi:two-component system, sensor histidine kinase and response regulator
MVEMVRTSGESLLTIINDILDFSKIEAGHVELEHIPFDLRQIIDDSLTVMITQAHAKRLELFCDLAPDIPKMAIGDPDRIRQILVNLVGNAVKFTERGHVVIRGVLIYGPTSELEQHDNKAPVHTDNARPILLRLDIEDTGIGMSPQTQGKLFSAFMQADSSTTRKFGGTGLGLAICRRLISLMHGTIEVISDLGNGSTFRLTLPLVLPPNHRDDHTSATHPSFINKRALLVYDYPIGRSINQTIIRSLSLDCDVANDGRSGLNTLRIAASSSRPYDYVIIDDDIRNVNCDILLQDIANDQSLQRLIPIVLTRMGQPRVAHGLQLLLDKPLRKSALYRVLAEAVSQHAKRGGERVGALSSLTTNEQSNSPNNRGRLLIAEDNPINQQLICAMVAKIGFQADVVSNGNEVLAAITRVPYDLILMDCQMPDMDGYTTTKNIRAQEHQLKTEKSLVIIALTANALSEDRQRCLDCGMDDYLAKPIKVSDLQTALLKWGDKSSNTPAS